MIRISTAQSDPKLSVAIAALLLAAPAAAQEPAPQPPPPAKEPAAAAAPAEAAASPSSVRVERTSSGQKLFRITEGLLVEGQRQKPNAFYVLQRASAPYDWEALDESFLPRIIKAAEKKPF